MEVGGFLESGSSILIDKPIGSSPICIVDSSFNPPNLAHQKLALIGLEKVPNSVVVFLLASGNADKPAAAPKELNIRLKLMNLLSESFESNFAGRVRCGLTTAPFFIDKARALASHYSNKLVFMVGFDTFVRFFDQKYYDRPIEQVLDEFFQLAEMMVLTRGDKSTAKLVGLSVDEQMQFSSPLFTLYESRIHIVRSGDDTANVSSTQARKSAADLAECCPAKVAEYVLSHNLYNWTH